MCSENSYQAAAFENLYPSDPTIVAIDLGFFVDLNISMRGSLDSGSSSNHEFVLDRRGSLLSMDFAK